MFLNIIISKSATKYHNSSTMANGIGREHKLGKKIESDLTAPLILPKLLQPIQIVMKIRMKH